MRNFIIFIFCFFSAQALAQDQLFKKDNSKIEVKVLEITPSEIKYKLKANPDGPTYVIYKTEVAMIIYENGNHEVFGTSQPVNPVEPQIVATPTIVMDGNPDSLRNPWKYNQVREFEKMTSTKNVIFVNAVEFLNAGVGLSYFREFYNGMFSVHVPVAFSLGEPYTYNFYRNLFTPYYYNVSNYQTHKKGFEGGLGIYFNTSGKRTVTHFIGPLVQIAQYNGSFEAFTPDPNDPNNYYGTATYQRYGFVKNETYMMINNGILFRLTPNFNMKMNFALGLVTNEYYVVNNPTSFATPYSNYYSQSSTLPFLRFGFDFGYRF